MPDVLPWLDGNPMILHVSRAGVIGSVSLWLAALIVLYLMLYEWRRKTQRSLNEETIP
jgi:hypothetical protein